MITQLKFSSNNPLKREEGKLYCLRILSNNVALVINTNSWEIAEFFLNDPFLKHHIPDVNVLKIEDSSSQITIPFYYVNIKNISETNKPHAEMNTKLRKIFISGTLGIHYKLKNLVFLFQQLFSLLYQENGSFSLHSGAVAINNSAIILLGGEKAGKSTITYLLSTKYQAQYLCDEKSIIKQTGDKQFSWIAGNSVLTTRDVIPMNEKLNNNFEEVTNISSLQHKSSLLVRNEIKKPIAIKQIYFVRLNSRASIIKEFYKEHAIYKIYSNLSEDIHGLWGAIVGIPFTMPSLDDPIIRKKRFQLAIDIGFSQIKIYQVEGEPDEICNMILRQISESN